MSLVAERGIALLIVVSILTVVGIMGVAFAFSLHLETQATREFVSTTQARYIAEGGVNHARALLDEDRLGTRIDALTESWASGLQGADADVDGDGALDARWLPIADPADTALGRYALQITDESGKVNLNMALADPPDTGPGAIDLTAVLQAAEISNASAVAGRIEAHRYGADGRPGGAGEDDDGDGSIDEPDEYQPMALRGDDRQLESLEDLATVAELDAQEIRHLSRFASVYARDLNITATGVPRINVNTATADELLSVWLKVGAGDPWRMAVNMADAADSDLAISRVAKSASSVMMSGGGSNGSWDWSADPVGHYASDEPDGAPLTWTAQVPAGTFYVLVRGVPGLRVGEVTLAGQTHAAVEDGDSLGLLELSNGLLEVEVAHREPAGTECAFRGLVLVSDQPISGTTVRGIEAVRFNELMIDPELDLPVSSATFDAQGSDWDCPDNANACQVSGVGQARWSWTSSALQPGRYYVRVFANDPGQTIGEVRVDGETQLLVHGQSHPRTVGVGSDGKITLSIGKTASEGTYYLASIQLSLQPDGEYVELINLSDEDLDIGGWVIDGELTGGRQGRLPFGTVIEPHGVLVAAVDLDDTQTGLSNNGIDAISAWAIPDDVPAVQLEFIGGGPTQDDDWLKSSVPLGATRLLLRRDETVVDEIEYALPPPTTAAFQSLEKGDPTVVTDEDADGVDEEWYPSLKLYTPGVTNDNNGLRELDGLEVILHDPAEEVTVLNRPLRGVGELAGVPSGEAWTPLAVADLARVADLFTVEGLQLEPSGRIVAGEAAWQETGDGSYAYSSPADPAVAGTWQWRDVPQGPYRLSVYGWPGERLSVRWQRRDDTWTDWSPDLSTDAQGRLVIGQITIGPPPVAEGDDAGTRDYTLTFEARCASQSGICHLDHIGLDPQLIRLGVVNVNTAPREVLLALPGMTAAKVDRLLDGRPYGDRDEKGRGIGDLLLGDALGTDDEEKLDSFRQLGHLLTTHSDTFQIMSLGQATQENKVRATQRILTVVER